MRAKSILVMTIIIGVASLASADMTTNEADFLQDVSLVNMESFEALPVDSFVSQHSSLTLADFTITEQSPTLSVHAIPNLGLMATDGDKYVRNTNGLAMTFTFNDPQTAFGVNIIDWGDNGGGAVLTFSNDIGDTFHIASVPQPSGAVLFFGITTDQVFTEVTLNQTFAHDSWAVDEVYYGDSVVIPAPPAVILGGLGLASAFWVGRKKYF